MSTRSPLFSRAVGGLALAAAFSLLPACSKSEASPGHASGSASAAPAGDSALPHEFPAAVKLYPGARIVKNTLGTGINGKPARTVEIATTDDIGKLRAFYAPSSLSSIKYNSGDASPGHPAWFTDTERFIDVRITTWHEGADSKASLVANLM
jgi:hypothetical protein